MGGVSGLQDSILFPLFEDEPLLTFGSDQRKIDYKAEWRKRLEPGIRQKERGKANEGEWVITAPARLAPARLHQRAPPTCCWTSSSATATAAPTALAAGA